jgi:hypothetical protein
VVDAVAPRVARVARQPVPPALDELVARCLAKDRAARPQSVDELIAAFATLLRETPWTQADATRWWRGPGAARAVPAVREPRETATDDASGRADADHLRRSPPAPQGPATDESHARAPSAP